MLASLKEKFVYYHIPKTGGISVRDTLKKHEDVRIEDYKHKLDRKIGGKRVWIVNPYHINQDQANELYDFSDFREFTVVREPLERIISLYNYGGASILFGSFQQFIQVVAKHYEKPNRYREIYNSQLYWITDKTTIIKLEDIIKDPEKEFAKVNINISTFSKKNENKKTKYYPNHIEMKFCLNFLSEEYVKLKYVKPQITCI
jgi:hypothetical protein